MNPNPERSELDPKAGNKDPTFSIWTGEMQIIPLSSYTCVCALQKLENPPTAREPMECNNRDKTWSKPRPIQVSNEKGFPNFRKNLNQKLLGLCDPNLSPLSPKQW